MKKIITISVCFALFLSIGLFSEVKKYEGPFVSELQNGKFKNSNFNSISFGSISFLKKKKLVGPGEEISIRIRKDGEKKSDTITAGNGKYFLIQNVDGLFKIEDIFFGKKYYKIDKKFYVNKSDLNYLGNIKITIIKESLENYSYKIHIDTNFKKLNFTSNTVLKGLINSNSPRDYLEKTRGKILIPIYQPSAKGQYSNEYNALKAVENGDKVSLEKFLKKGDILNKIWENGQTLLMTSLEFKNEEIAKFLISMDPDISIKTKSGWDHLMFATRYNMIEPAKLLINKGIDVTGEISGGWNNLFMALRNGCDMELLDMLLEKGCKINKPKDNKWTPLMMALCYRNEELADSLYRKGAEINVKDNENWTPLMYALRYGKNKLAEKMIEKDKDINASNKNGWTPLLFALRNGAGKCAKKLIESGADTLATERDGNTPLHFALEYKFPEIADIIIRKGKGLDKVTRYGWTPLMVALRYDQPDAALLLLEKGATVNGFTKDGWSTLHLAVRYNMPAAAISIIKRKKLNLDDVTAEGWTPLLLALRYNHPEIAAILLKSGVNINLGNKFGWTPLMIAIEYDQPQLAEKLIKMGALQNAKNNNGDTAIDIAKKKKYFSLFKLLGGKGLLSETPHVIKTTSAISGELNGTFKTIIPKGKNPRVIKCDDCTPQSNLCNALLEYDSPKLEVFKYLISELKGMGFKYDTEIKAGRESGSLKNKNIWGLVNFTMNTSTMVNAFTIIILSDYKTGTNKTRVDFNLSRMPKKMNINLPKLIK